MRENSIGRAMLFLLFVLLATPSFSADAGNDRKGLEAKLREQMVGKVAVLRNFYEQSELMFDSHGDLVGSSKTGPWTYYGRVQVTSVALNENSVVFKGERNVVQWEISSSEFKNYTLDQKPVRITIQLEPNFSESDLAAAITRVFLTRTTRLSDVAPAYWRDILTTERERRAELDKERAEAMKDVQDLAPEVSAPRLLSRADGIDTSSQPFKNLLPNNLTFSFIVDQKGDVKELQIEKPVGLGLDDPIAETILRWKWEPAKKNGTPVAVLMYAKVLFPAEKGHIDPFNTNPCRYMPNVYQC